MAQDDSLTAVTVLFADISGSTRLYAVRGDAAAFQLTSQCLALLEQQVTAAQGRVVKRLGDAVLAVFETAPPAVDAAVEMQRALADPDSTLRQEGLHVRVGISSGAAVLAPDDVFGDVVNVAARLVSLAGGDEIVFSGTVHEALPAAVRDAAHLIDHLTLRNRPDPVPVYKYVWGLDNQTVLVNKKKRGGAATLEITRGEQRFAVGASSPRLTLGRANDNDLVIAEQAVSRYQAEIALRGDKFVLVDRSTNGTYVNVDGGPTFRVSRDEVTLSGSGTIVPGLELDPPIRYRITHASTT